MIRDKYVKSNDFLESQKEKEILWYRKKFLVTEYILWTKMVAFR